MATVTLQALTGTGSHPSVPTDVAASLVIPFDYRNGFIVVRARVNAFFSAELVFDTGSEHTIVTEPLLFGALNAEAVEPIRIVGSDLSTSIDAALSRRNSLTVGAVSLSNQAVIAVDDSALDLSTLAGENISGILGIGAFGAYVIEIDYRREIIRLTRPSRFRPGRLARAAPLTLVGGKPHVRLFTQVHADYCDTLLYLIDTGAAIDALVFAAPADSAIYPPRVIAGVIGHGLGGNLAGFVGRSDTIALPGRAFTGVVTHFQILADGTRRDSLIERDGLARHGIVGNGLLDQFNLAIDLPGAKVYFTPRRKPPAPRPYDRSGLTVVDEPTERGGLLVQFVSPGTPAAEAGLRAGDRIRKINKLPLRLISTANFRRRLRRRPGRQVSIQYDRRGLTYETVLILRDII